MKFGGVLIIILVIGALNLQNHASWGQHYHAATGYSRDQLITDCPTDSCRLPS